MGGLGFRDLKDFNTALLAKQCWKIIQSPSSLIGRILKAKYFPHSDFLNANLGRKSSYIWKSLLSARDLLVDGGVWRIGDEWDINIWGQSWLPTRPGSRLMGPAPEHMQEAKVAEFIDHTMASWQVDKLNSSFPEADVEAILQVRIPQHYCADKLCWPGQRFGEYSVKSGYKWLRDLKEVEPAMQRLYKAIWGCDLPPKLRHFAWRLCKGILPTTSALYERKVSVTNQCSVCSLEAEDTNHALALCGWTFNVWNRVSLPTTPLSFGADNCVLEWLLPLVENHALEVFERGIVIMWMVWLDRNNSIFNGGICDGHGISARVDQFIMNYRESRSPKEQMPANRTPSWFPPPEGCFKLNCDGSYKGAGRGGIGAIVRDEERAVLGVMAAPITQCGSAKEVEAVAVRDGLQFAKDCGFGRVLVESDAKEIIDEVQRQHPSSSLHGHIIAEIKSLMSGFDYCAISFISRQCNSVADRLASIGSSISQPSYWLEEIPDCITDVILHDI